MEQKNYRCTIGATISAKEAFQRITQVSAWWSENIEGRFDRLNDIFTIRFVFGDSFVIKIVEIVPDKKIVWKVMDSNLTWVKDSKEWKGTSIHFDIASHNNSTQVNFTHVGLVPEMECYNGCTKGWDQYIKASLFKFLTEGKGLPDKKR